MNYERLEMVARMLACHSFVGVVDKGGNPYFDHCVTVADGAYNVAKALGLDEDLCMVAKIAGMLHDVVEDTEVSVDDIESQFGALIAVVVDNVSKRKDESRELYFRRVFSHQLSMVVKFADSNHNSQLNRIENPSAYMVKKCAGYAKFNSILGEKLGLI